MASIQFLCVSCQRVLQVDESQKGGQATCPACNVQMTVPDETVNATAQANLPPRAQLVGGSPFASYPPPPQPQETEGFAIASFVCSLTSPAICISSLLGIIFGHIAMSRIKASGGRLGGKGFAVAGLAIGYIYLVLTVVFGVIWVTVYAIMLGIFFTNMEHPKLKVENPPAVTVESEKSTLCPAPQTDTYPNHYPTTIYPDNTTPPMPAPSCPYPPSSLNEPVWVPTVPGEKPPIVLPAKPEIELPPMGENELVPQYDKPPIKLPLEDDGKPAEVSPSSEGEKAAEETPKEEAAEDSREKVPDDAPAEEPAKE